MEKENKQNIIYNYVDSKYEINILTDIGAGMFNDGYTFSDFKEDVDSVINDVDEIIVNISSYGGDLYEALAIYDYINELDVKVTTKVQRTSASAATIISLAGNVRKINENAKYLIHKPMLLMQGNSDDFTETLDELKELDEVLVNMYVNSSNMSKDEVLDLMREEKFISAKEAKEKGLIDEIVYNTKSNEVMDKSILEMAGVSNNSQLKKKLNTLTNAMTEKNALEDENKELKDKVQALEKEKEEAPANPEPGESNEEYIEKLEAERDALKERVSELEEKLKEKEEKDKETEAENFVNENIEAKVINAKSKEQWLNTVKSVGIDEAKVLLNSVARDNVKVSDEIDDSLDSLTKSEIVNKWKKGEINTKEYLNLIK